MFPFFEFILGFMVFQHIFDTYLDIRQHNNFKEKNVPKELTEFVTKEQFTKSQEYNLAKSSFAFIRGNFGFVIGLISIWYLPFLWALSLEHIELLGFDESNTIVRSVYFFFATQALNYVISLPFTLYSTFVIEERFGFNKQTMALFIKDQIKVILLTVVIGTPILAAVLWIIEWGGEYFWLYVWSFITAVQLIMIPVYQHVIAPLFNEFKPLEEGELRTTLGELAKRVSFPLTEIFVIDGSTRSSHSNAYFFGFFKNKRIVIYDTLIKQVDTKGIEAIVGHELGHYKMSHNLKNIIIHVSHSLVFFYLFGQFLHNMTLYHSFGFEKQSTLIGLTLFMYVYGPVDSILSLALNFLSRHFEYQADAFAVDLGYDLSGPLAKIHTENSGNLNPDPWYSAYHFSHPTLKERVHAMRKLMAKKK